TLRVQYRPDVLAPESLFLRSVGDREATGHIEVIDYRDAPLKITEIRTSTPKLIARLVETPNRYLPGWRYLMKISFSGSGLPPGEHSESIQISTADPEHPIITVKVVIRRANRYRVAPPTLRLQKESTDPDTYHGVIYLDDTEGEQVSIRSVE